MNIIVGQKIKKLRLEKEVTQENLAEYLGISYQAISKWENGTTSPDIGLLPEIAIFFGVTIDDLFSISNDDITKRIDKILQDSSIISHENYDYIKKNCLQFIKENPEELSNYSRMSGLHEKRAIRDLHTATNYVEEALKVDPFNTSLHNKLIFLRRNLLEFGRLQKYYIKFINSYPNNINGYIYLSTAYIHDLKINDAYSIILKGQKINPNNTELLIQLGKVYSIQNKVNEAKAIWESILQLNPDDYSIWFLVGENYAMINEYKQALKCWETSYKINPENLSGIYNSAFIYDHIGEYNCAIEMWKIIIEWFNNRGTFEGSSVDWPNSEIERLNKKLNGIPTAY